MTSGIPPAPAHLAPAPPDPDRVADTVQRKLPFAARMVSLTALAGDASNRRYFRVAVQGTPSSVILMQLASPEAFKQSEEAVTGACPITELPFINVLTYLARLHVPVPVLYHYDVEAGLLYLEDFGDVTLLAAYQKAEPSAGAAFYRDAIDILIRIQGGASSGDPGCIAFQRAFDVPLLLWEFDHFLEYGVEARHGTMSAGDREAVRRGFEQISIYLAAQPRVFAHRDYHSRNLMVREPLEDLPARAVGEVREAPNQSPQVALPALTRAPGRLGVIDFQDALLGPVSYDLASLLRDAYIELDESLIEELLAYYRERATSSGPALPPASEFRKLFDFTSIQRNLKAAGRFVYIDRVKGNPNFLADVPRVLGYVRRNLAKYPELATLRRSLARYVPELQ